MTKGGFKVPRVSLGSKVKTQKVSVPRNNPAGRMRPPLGLPHASAPRVKRNTRDYSKLGSIADPAQDIGGGTGFGQTGLTGET
jgi:hypothetical protein